MAVEGVPMRRRSPHPVAVALAREKLRQLTLDQKIDLYLKKDGDSCELMCSILQRIFLTVAAVASKTKKIGPEDVRVRKLRGAASACEQMAARDAYQELNTTSLADALDLVLELNKTLDPDQVLREWAQGA